MYFFLPRVSSGLHGKIFPNQKQNCSSSKSFVPFNSVMSSGPVPVNVTFCTCAFVPICECS